MAIPLVVNGVTFQYPQQFDKNWGPTLTSWSQAVTNGMLQKAGGTFTLTAEVDFGSSFGIKVKSIKSTDSNIASTGYLRLPNASAGIVWRNALNNADLALTVNASNQLTFNGTNIGATTSLTDSHILVGNASNQPADVAMSGDITITNAGVTAIGAGKVLNGNINASAAIALSKLASTSAYFWYVANVSGVLTPIGVTASRAVATDANGLPTVTSTTATELGYVNGVTSAIQTQINSKLNLSGGTMSGAINMGSNKITAVTQGSNTGEAISFPVDTAQISANAVTQYSQSTSGATITGTRIAAVDITTTGGPVLILASMRAGLVASGTGGGNMGLETYVTRDTTSVPGATANWTLHGLGDGVNLEFAPSLNAIDTPPAGSYTYRYWYVVGVGTLNTINTYSLQVIELKR